MLRTGPDYEASGSTRDIHELQAALQAAQLTATGTGSKYSGTQMIVAFRPISNQGLSAPSTILRLRKDRAGQRIPPVERMRWIFTQMPIRFRVIRRI